MSKIARVIALQILKTEGCSFELDVYLSHTRTVVRDRAMIKVNEEGQILTPRHP